MAQQKGLQNMKILKRRIIMTDELIGKYKEKVQDCEKSKEQITEMRSQLCSLQNCIHGLKREMDSLYQEKEKFRTDWELSVHEEEELKKENERLKWGLLSEEQMNRTLVGELRETQCKQQENASLHTENKELTIERDKWKEMYQKLRREELLRSGKRRVRGSRRGSSSHFDASLLPTPLTSPPSSMGSMDHMNLHFSSDSEAEDMVEVNKLSAVLSGKGELQSEITPTVLNGRARYRRGVATLPHVPSSASMSSRSISPLAPFSPPPISPKAPSPGRESPSSSPSPAARNLVKVASPPPRPSVACRVPVPAVDDSVTHLDSCRTSSVACHISDTTHIYSTKAHNSLATTATCHDSVPTHPAATSVVVHHSQCEPLNIDADCCEDDSDEELEFIFSQFCALNVLSPLPQSPVLSRSSTIGLFPKIRSPTLSPLLQSPASMRSSLPPLPSSPNKADSLSPLPQSPPVTYVCSPLQAPPTVLASFLPRPPSVTLSLSPLPLSPSVSPLSPLQQPPSVTNSLSPLPLSPAVSPLSPLHQPPSVTASLSPIPPSPAVSLLSSFSPPVNLFLASLPAPDVSHPLPTASPPRVIAPMSCTSLVPPQSSPPPLQCHPLVTAPLPPAQYSPLRNSDRNPLPLQCRSQPLAVSLLPLTCNLLLGYEDSSLSKSVYPSEPTSLPESLSAFSKSVSPFEPTSLPESLSAFSKSISPSEPTSLPQSLSAFSKSVSPSEPTSPPQSLSGPPMITPSQQSPGAAAHSSPSSPISPSSTNLHIELFGLDNQNDDLTAQLPFANMDSEDSETVFSIPSASSLDNNTDDGVQSGCKKRLLSPEKNVCTSKVKKRRELVNYSDCLAIPNGGPRDELNSVSRVRTRCSSLGNISSKIPSDKKLSSNGVSVSEMIDQSKDSCDEEVVTGVSNGIDSEAPSVLASGETVDGGTDACSVEVMSVGSGGCGPLPGSRCGYGIPMDMPTHQQHAKQSNPALPWNDELEHAPWNNSSPPRRGRRGRGRNNRAASSKRTPSSSSRAQKHFSNMGLHSPVKSNGEVPPSSCTEEVKLVCNIGPMEELLSGEIMKTNIKTENYISNETKTVLVPPSAPSLAPSPDLSVAQRSLCTSMQCPLPLPLWLVSAMTEVQSMEEHCVLKHWGKKKKRRGPRINGVMTEPVFRRPHQQPQYYVFSNLEHLASGQLHLSAIITMFTDTNSVPSSNAATAGLIQFFLEVYNPDIEHVLALFRGQCKKLTFTQLTADPLDPNFVPALLRPECQIVALLAHMCRLSPVMSNLLHEASWALQQAVMKHGLNFHKLLAMSRVFTALIRLQADSERLLFFIADLLKKPILPNEMYVIVGVGSIWPSPPCRKKCPPLQKLRSVNLKVLEGALLRTTLEVAVLHKYRSEGVKAGVHEAFPKNLQTYYGWESSLPADRLAESLLQILQTSDNVTIDLSPMNLTPWQRPRPSVIAYQVVYCLNVLAACKRWSWTNDFLIGKHLWPILQEWSGKKGSAKSQDEEEGGVVIKDAVVVCVLRLIGFLCSFGVKEEPASTSTDQLRRVMMALLNEAPSSSRITLPMQLATIDSLMEMTPPKDASRLQIVGVVKAWLRNQESRQWFYPLQTELHQRFKLTL